MFKKIMPYINIGLASIMLFVAMPNLNFSGQIAGEVFWVVWTILCLGVIAANGNMLLMTQEKKERLQHIKRMRKMKREQKLLSLINKKQAKEHKQVKQTG